MAYSSIQGQPLEITVVGCTKLRDTEWISRQDPYVCLEYGSSKFRTRTHTDGGKNPTFQDKFVFTLIEGIREVSVVVWNSNTVTFDDLIGSGKIQLQKVLSTGYDDSSWPIQTKTGRHAGEVRLIMHFANANKSATSHASYGVSHISHSQNLPYSYAPPPPSAYAPPPPSAYAPPPPSAYATPPLSQAYPAQYPYQSQPPTAYPQSAYAPTPQPQGVYPSPPYPPPSTYPPSQYPPPPYGAPHYPPPGPYGVYPPPPY